MSHAARQRLHAASEWALRGGEAVHCLLSASRRRLRTVELAMRERARRRSPHRRCAYPRSWLRFAALRRTAGSATNAPRHAAAAPAPTASGASRATSVVG